MHIVDVGEGTPIVMIPGVQGRWEWMRPAVDALAARCRVVTFSLADEPTSGTSFDAADVVGSYVRQVADAMDAAGLERAAVCGVSYGGLVAAAFAARHAERVSSLVLVSALPPGWSPDARVRFFLRAPRLLTPLFLLSSLRLHREIAAATPGVLAGMGASLRHMARASRYLFNPARMARRVQSLARADATRELAGLRVPTLVVTGEPGLDRVVRVNATREYLRLWPHARAATIAHTGHLGLITRPDEFARIVGDFVDGVNGVGGHLKRTPA